MDELEWGDLYIDQDTGIHGKYFCPHEAQQDLLETKSTYILALGGVNSGKTAVAMLWLVNEINRLGTDQEYLIIGPTYSVVMSSTLTQWMKTVKGTALEGDLKGAGPATYTMGTGGKVYFRSAEAAFDGLKPLASVIDEGGDCNENLWHSVRRRMVGNKGGRCLISTTPYLNYDWIPREICQRADDGDKAYFYRCMLSTANPTTDLVKLERDRREKPKWEFEMYYEGKFNKPPGLIYDFKTADGDSCFVDIPENGLPDGSYWGTVDWGGTDPTVALCAVLDVNDCLWVFWERYIKSEDILQTISHLKEFNVAFEKSTKKKIMTWWCDHRPECIRALRKNNLQAKPAKKGPDSIAIGISLVQARMRTGRLKIIQNKCPNLRIESNLYRYPMVDGQIMGTKPLAGNDHVMDCIRYLVMGIDRKQIKSTD